MMPQNVRTTVENRVLIALGVVFGVLLLFGIVAARTENRDDDRIAHLAELKTALEMMYNDHNNYGIVPASESCTDTGDENSWLFSPAEPLLAEGYLSAVPQVPSRLLGKVYTYCATSITDGESQGYYLETELEQDFDPLVAFDEDEGRKFGYRIVVERGRSLYRICGGEEHQCDTE